MEQQVQLLIISLLEVILIILHLKFQELVLINLRLHIQDNFKDFQILQTSSPHSQVKLKSITINRRTRLPFILNSTIRCITTPILSRIAFNGNAFINNSKFWNDGNASFNDASFRNAISKL